MGNTGHELQFNPNVLIMMLRWHGFQLLKLNYEQILPVNLGSLPNLVKIYHRLQSLVSAVDLLLRKIPLLNMLSTSYHYHCRRAQCKF